MAATSVLPAEIRVCPELSSKYELGPLLGKGGFGSVFSCYDKTTGKQLACKVLNREHVRSTIGVEPSKEINIMKMLADQHYGLIQLKDAFEDEVNCYAVMEFCAGGSLLDVLKSHGAMPERSAKVVLGQVAAALAYCHSKRVMHLDIKPENIFFAEGASESLYGTGLSELASLSSLFSSLDVRARLADFGMATILKAGKKVRGDVGSPHFKAPEIVGGKKFGLEVDVWSLGVVLSVMLTGAVPFLGTSNNDYTGLNKAILSGNIDFSSARWRKVSAEAIDLVRKMLTVDPTRRITAAEILDHPWFKNAEEEILPIFAKEALRTRESAAKPFAVASPMVAKVAAPKVTTYAAVKLNKNHLRLPKAFCNTQRSPVPAFVQGTLTARFAGL